VKVKLAKLALADLNEIYARSVLQWGETQADSYVTDLWSTFDTISASPDRWRLRPEIHPDCRICFCGRHAILFRIHNGRVEIGRVLHDRMDYKRHIPRSFTGEP
jgi:toxin ParE1/3/4